MKFGRLLLANAAQSIPLMNFARTHSRYAPNADPESVNPTATQWHGRYGLQPTVPRPGTQLSVVQKATDAVAGFELAK
jgi:hypothetical protein